MPKKTNYIFVAAAYCLMIVSYGCKQQQPDTNKKPENTFSVNGGVREINIWPETPDFPEHDGKGEFMSYTIT